jgi:hypothetical protein
LHCAERFSFDCCGGGSLDAGGLLGDCSALLPHVEVGNLYLSLYEKPASIDSDDTAKNASVEPVERSADLECELEDGRRIQIPRAWVDESPEKEEPPVYTMNPLQVVYSSGRGVSRKRLGKIVMDLSMHAAPVLPKEGGCLPR